MSLLLYAVVDEAAGLLGDGAAGEPLRALGLDGFAAIVGPAETAPPIDVSRLRAHDAVLRRLAAAVPALLPARYGTLVAGEAGLARLAARRVELLEALTLVRGREQHTLRLYGEAVPAPTPTDTADLGPGARYLLARARAARVPELGPLREALAPFVRGERVERHAAPPLVASVYHLVDRGGAEAYRSVVAAQPAAPGVSVRASGPWPAYAFAPEAVAP